MGHAFQMEGELWWWRQRQAFVPQPLGAPVQHQTVSSSIKTAEQLYKSMYHFLMMTHETQNSSLGPYL